MVYLGLRQSAAEIVEAALQEDADLIGLSVLSGAHMTHFRSVLDQLDLRGGRDILVFGGGIVPEEDMEELKRLGVRKVFTPGAPTGDIVDWVRKALKSSDHETAKSRV